MSLDAGSWVAYHAQNMALPRSRRAWSNPNAKAVWSAMRARQRYVPFSAAELRATSELVKRNKATVARAMLDPDF